MNVKDVNRDIAALEALIKEIEADEDAPPVVSMEEFIGRGGKP